MVARQLHRIATIRLHPVASLHRNQRRRHHGTLDTQTGQLPIEHILTVDEFCRLLEQFAEPYRTMVLIAQCLGLRVSEIMGLKWGDFDFKKRKVLVQRSVVVFRNQPFGTKRMAQPPPEARCRVSMSLCCTILVTMETCRGFWPASSAS